MYFSFDANLDFIKEQEDKTSSHEILVGKIIGTEELAFVVSANYKEEAIITLVKNVVDYTLEERCNIKHNFDYSELVNLAKQKYPEALL